MTKGMRAALLAPPAIVIQIPGFVRCNCPECLRLDREFPGQGYQLGFWPYVPLMRRVK